MGSVDALARTSPPPSRREMATRVATSGRGDGKTSDSPRVRSAQFCATIALMTGATSTLSPSLPAAAPYARRAAWLLAGVELFFSLAWVVYVVFLPDLLARAGVDKRFVPWVLAADQLIFAVADWAVGVAVDRARAALRRIGPMLATLSIISALAMLLLPWMVTLPAFFLLLTAVWVATSAALRAPPYVLLSRHAARAALPRLAGLQLLGLAIASALAPYLAVTLKGVDPAWPFALSALAVAVSSLALIQVERAQPATAGAATGGAEKPDDARRTSWVMLLLLALLLASGQQVHTAINAASQFKRLVDPALLPWFLPIFWVGFSFGLLCVGRLVQVCGVFVALQLACVAGVLALTSSVLASSLPWLVVSQTLAGALWGLVLCTSIGVAAGRGGASQAGRGTGALMATLAVAAMSRISLVAGGWASAPMLDWLPVILWGAAACLLLRVRSA